MKKIASLGILLAGLFLILTLSGCGEFHYIAATGQLNSLDYDYEDFDSVDISNSFEYEIEKADNYSIEIEAYESIVPYLDIYKSGTTLVVSLKNGYFTDNQSKVFITMPEIDDLEVSGACSGKLTGFDSMNDMSIEVSGASTLDMDITTGDSRLEVSGASKISGNLKTGDLRLTVSGASTCELSGYADDCNVEVSGASTLAAPEFEMQDVYIDVSGASHATIYTDEKLSAEVSGASHLKYLGKPDIRKTDISGASSLENINQ